MLTKLDDFLLDRVFQPWADHLADRISPLVLGAVLIELYGLVMAWLWMRDWMVGRNLWLAPFFLLLLVAVVAFRHRMLRTDGRLRLGHMNPLRQRWADLRAFIIATFIVCSPTLFFAESLAEVMEWLISQAAIIGALYFGSCQKSPPPQKKEQEATGPLAWGTGGA